MALLRNASFNFMGAAAPAVLGVLTVPYVVRTLGVEDFGLLALITSIVGYFAILDINVTSGATKYVAEYKSSGDGRRLNETLCFGWLVYAAIGALGGLGLFCFADLLVSNVFLVPPARHAEAAAALRVASIGFLFGQLQAYLQSLPGAMMRFDVSGKIEAVFGTAVPLLTVLILAVGMGLTELVWLRVGMSLLQSFVLLAALRRMLPEFEWRWPTQDVRAAILAFSSYAFLSRLAALTYAHADKLFISAKVGVAALTYYVVPSTLANRVMALVFRLSGVMFPHASALAAQQRMVQLERDYLAATRYMLLLNGGIALTLAMLAHPILTLWLGAEFAQTGTAVMVMIALAQWVDSLTNLPSLVNDGLGHPRVSGLFALARAVLGLALIYLGVSLFGILGAAGAHLIASLVMSTAFLAYVHGRTIPVPLRALIRNAGVPSLAVLLPFALLGWSLRPVAAHGWLGLLTSAACLAIAGAAAAWWCVLLPEHRDALRMRLHSLTGGRTA